MSKNVWAPKAIMVIFVFMALVFLGTGFYDYALKEIVLSELLKTIGAAALLFGLSLRPELLLAPIKSLKVGEKPVTVGPAYLSDSLLFGGIIIFGIAYFL